MTFQKIIHLINGSIGCSSILSILRQCLHVFASASVVAFGEHTDEDVHEDDGHAEAHDLPHSDEVGPCF